MPLRRPLFERRCVDGALGVFRIYLKESSRLTTGHITGRNGTWNARPGGSAGFLVEKPHVEFPVIKAARPKPERTRLGSFL